jgi:hypothetical protein
VGYQDNRSQARNLFSSSDSAVPVKASSNQKRHTAFFRPKREVYLLAS